MEDEKFDETTRSLAEGGSRRRVIGGMLGGVLGALGLGAAAREADAAAKKPKKPKKKKKVKVCYVGQTQPQSVSKERWLELKTTGQATLHTGTGPCLNPVSPPPPPKHHDDKDCAKLHQTCGKGKPACCGYDPKKGYALKCDESKKHKVCVKRDQVSPPPPGNVSPPPPGGLRRQCALCNTATPGQAGIEGCEPGVLNQCCQVGGTAGATLCVQSAQACARICEERDDLAEADCVVLGVAAADRVCLNAGRAARAARSR